MTDNINPDHYKTGGIETIDFIEAKALNYNTGNAVKYISRAGKKDPDKHIEDLSKARWYIDREIQRLEAAQKEALEAEYYTTTNPELLEKLTGLNKKLAFDRLTKLAAQHPDTEENNLTPGEIHNVDTCLHLNMTFDRSEQGYEIYKCVDCSYECAWSTTDDSPF